MPTMDKTTYLSPDDYERAIGVLRSFTKMALLWLVAKGPDNLKHHIITNFIARGAVCLDSIHLLWTAGNYQDCWVLHRALVDRLIHIKDLIDQDQFEEFERWSFQRQYQSSDAALSDPMITAKLGPETLAAAKLLLSERRSRFHQEPKSTWRRPKAEDVAKRINSPFIYSIGYDPASAEVHPMADDGKEEFHKLFGLELESYGDDRIPLQNSLVMQFLLVRYGISGCDVQWRDFVSDFLDLWFSFLETGSLEKLVQAQQVLTFDTSISWCEPSSEHDS